MAYKVFISYASKDIDLVRDLAQRLKNTGIEVNFDQAVAPGSMTSNKRTNKAFTNADEIFVMLTTESINNPNLMFFLGAGASLGKRLSPVVVGLEASEIPPLIKSLKYIKYPDLGRYIDNLEKRTKAAA